MQQTILFGNGINRLSTGDFEWLQLLETVNRRRTVTNTNISYSHIYEDLLVNGAHNDMPESLDITDRESTLKKSISECIRNLSASDATIAMYRRLFALPVDYFLTTNYDYIYEKALNSLDYVCDVKHSDASERIYSLHRKRVFNNGHKSISVWPVHGELQAPSSMMLGYDHYCCAIGAMLKYITNGSDKKELNPRRSNYLARRNKYKHYLPYILYRVRHNEIPTNYWIDTFFNTDVHIIASGLDFAETDLWWILDKRVRHKQSIWCQHKTDYPISMKNKIYLYGCVRSNEIMEMLKAYDVDITNVITREPKDWEAQYNEWIDCMAKNIRIRSN